MRVPQCPQNGRPLSEFLLHRGQREVMRGARGGDAVFWLNAAGGTATRAAVADPDPPDPFVGGVVAASLPAAAAPLLTPTWAAEAVIGFPQSMQNREVASFSRPQNEQAVNRHPPRRENVMAREYRTPLKVRQLSNSGVVEGRFSHRPSRRPATSLTLPHARPPPDRSAALSCLRIPACARGLAQSGSKTGYIRRPAAGREHPFGRASAAPHTLCRGAARDQSRVSARPAPDRVTGLEFRLRIGRQRPRNPHYQRSTGQGLPKRLLSGLRRQSAGNHAPLRSGGGCRE